MLGWPAVVTPLMSLPMFVNAVPILSENVPIAAAIPTATTPTRIAYSSADTASLARIKLRNRRGKCSLVFVFFITVILPLG